MKLYGKNPVIERLKSNPKSIRRIHLQEGLADGAYIYKKARQWGIPVFSVPRPRMIKLSKTINSQGVLAEIDDFAYMDYDELLEMAVKRDHSIIFLDNLNDPQNLGGIIRNTACLGKFSIVLPVHDSVEVTEAVLRVASGGDNYVSISKVSNLSQAISAAKKKGFWIAGGVAQGGEDLKKASLLFPLGLVLGSEQKGIRETIQKQLNLKLTIPMAYPKLSLNVAQTAGIFCYEITKQKNQKNS